MAQKKEKKKNNIKTWAGSTICVVTVLFLYFPVLSYDILNWDDPKYITENPYIKTLSWVDLKHYFTDIYFLMYLPLTMLSYNIDYQISGFSGEMFHFTSLFLHILNTVLVFYAFSVFFKQLNNKNSFGYSLFIALMFGLHAVHIESVAWLAERKDVLYTFFYFIAFIFYLYYIKKQNQKFLWLSVVFFLFSLVSKAQAMTFSLVLLGVDYVFGRNLLSKKVILEKIPFFVLSIIFGLIAILATRSEGVENVDQYPFYERIIYASYAYIMYIAKILLPINLSAIYPFPDKIYNGLPTYFWIYPVLICGIIASFFYLVKKHKLFAYGLWFFTVSIIIVLQVFSYHNVLMADRYTYVSAIGIFVLMVVLFDLLISKIPKIKPLVLVFAFLYVGVQAVIAKERLPVWKNNFNLWTDVIEKHDNVATAFYNRGIAYFNDKKYNKAISDFKNVILLDTTSSGAYFSIANAYSELNDLNTAMTNYDKAIKKDSTDAKYYSNRGIALAKLGKVNLAVSDFNKSIQLEPENATAYSNRGNSRFMLKDVEGAIADYAKAIELQDDYVDPIFNRGSAFLQIGKYNEAINDFNNLLKLTPENAKAWANRADCYMNLKKPENAIADYTQSIKLNNKNIDALFKRGNAFMSAGQLENAFKDFSQTIKLLPNHPTPYYQRGIVAIQLGNKQSACSDFQKSLQLGNKAALTQLKQHCN